MIEFTIQGTFGLDLAIIDPGQDLVQLRDVHAMSDAGSTSLMWIKRIGLDVRADGRD